MSSDAARVRREAFASRIDFSRALAAMASTEVSHAFLVNPAGQNVYLYLARYVRMLAEAYFAKPIAELEILDWGAGKGHFTYLLAEEGANPTSCDVEGDVDDSSFGQATPIIDQTAIQVILLTDPVLLPFDDRSFDIVVSVGVLEHVPDDEGSVREISRVLRPGGLFVCVNLPTTRSWTQNLAHARGSYYHDRLYSRRRVEQLAAISDLEILDLWYRQLLPKNSIRYPAYRVFEAMDQALTEHTPLRYFATNIEFVARRRDA